MLQTPSLRVFYWRYLPLAEPCGVLKTVSIELLLRRAEGIGSLDMETVIQSLLPSILSLPPFNLSTGWLLLLVVTWHRHGCDVHSVAATMPWLMVWQASRGNTKLASPANWGWSGEPVLLANTNQNTAKKKNLVNMMKCSMLNHGLHVQKSCSTFWIF